MSPIRILRQCKRKIGHQIHFALNVFAAGTYVCPDHAIRIRMKVETKTYGGFLGGKTGFRLIRLVIVWNIWIGDIYPQCARIGLAEENIDVGCYLKSRVDKNTGSQIYAKRRTCFIKACNG